MVGGGVNGIININDQVIYDSIELYAKPAQHSKSAAQGHFDSELIDVLAIFVQSQLEKHVGNISIRRFPQNKNNNSASRHTQAFVGGGRRQSKLLLNIIWLTAGCLPMRSQTGRTDVFFVAALAHVRSIVRV